MQIIDYLPVEIVFNLLCLYRTGTVSHPQSIRAALKRRGLRSITGGPGDAQRPVPRVSFWIRLCQAASLLDEGIEPYPTLFADQWVSWSFYDMIACLVEAWIKVPKTRKFQQIRARLLQHLQQSKTLGVAQRQQLVGLQALGVCARDQLSELGFALLTGSGQDRFVGISPEKWQITGDQLLIPFPPDWKLVWELEKYVDAGKNGIYSLYEPTLRLAAQRGALENKPSLTEILECGLGEQLPDFLSQALNVQPVIRLIPGQVLEFSSPDELKQLRCSPGLRKELDHLLSPRHVALDPWRGMQVLKRLYRQGLISKADFLASQPATPSTNSMIERLTKSERVYLLSLVLLSEGLQNVIAPPPGLLSKLIEGVDHPLRASAARRATKAINQIHPPPIWQPEEMSPPAPVEDLLETIQDAIDRSEAINVLYQASGRHSPEYRYLTPLLVEQRGERCYLIAYCHTRRANRTFRLDRLKLMNELLE